MAAKKILTSRKSASLPGGKTVGAVLDPETATRLSLLALATGVPKSDIIRAALHDALGKEDVEELVGEVANRLKATWLLMTTGRAQQNSQTSLVQFKKEARESFEEQRDLPDFVIDLIAQKFDEAAPNV